jgi:radical SAM/Cys-rich protein
MQQTEPRTDHQDAFIARLTDCGAFPLRATGIDILQMNITRRCNLACKHCHVQAGPQRTEMMSRETMRSCIAVAGNKEISTVDITGGAPEMHPDLEWLIGELAALKKRLIVRSNLLVMREPAYRHCMDVFAANKVEVVGSLPDYNAEKSDRQRGVGTFGQVIQAIRDLNHRSFGVPDSGLLLHLVHNLRSVLTCRGHSARWKRNTTASCAMCTVCDSTPFSAWSTAPSAAIATT